MIGEYELELKFQQRDSNSNFKTLKINATIYEPAVVEEICKITDIVIEKFTGPSSTMKAISTNPNKYQYQIGKSDELIVSFGSQIKLKPDNCTSDEVLIPMIRITQSSNPNVEVNSISLPHIFGFNPFTNTFKLDLQVGNNSEITEANKWMGTYTFTVTQSLKNNKNINVLLLEF